MELWLIIIFYILVLSLFCILLHFKWIIKTIREIASYENRGGYTKLIQIGIIFFLISIFCFIVGYYIRNPEKVDRISIILTVVVGWLGAIIGRFFGENAMDSLNIERKVNVSEMKTIIDKYRNLMSKIKEKIIF